METIFALASAPGRAGVAVIRIAGPQIGEVFAALDCAVPENGRGVRKLKAEDGTTIDEALVLHFAHGQSFTGDETCELHIHGSPAVVNFILRRLGQIKGLRLALAGEFTRRAFENGRLDLSQVEGLSDLLAAETELQRKQALLTFDGELGRFAMQLRERLLAISALFAAAIDFADEEIPDTVLLEAKDEIRAVSQKIASQLKGAGAAERLRDGFVVSILGAPNAGKSTLLNRIAGRDAAIVSDIAGTTRDSISVFCDLDGLPVTFIDTAGLRETDDPIEKIGIERSLTLAEKSDIRIFLDTGEKTGLSLGPDDIRCPAKADISGEAGGVSGLTGLGLEDLLDLVRKKLMGKMSNASLVAHARQRAALERALEDLNRAELCLTTDGDVSLASESILCAGRAMECICGLVGVEDVLGAVFSRFCVGK